MIVDLLVRNGQVAGAIGMNTRDGSLTLFKTKSVVLTTGACFRLFMNITGVLMNTYYPPSSTGDGLAIALRAGAALANMEGTNAIRGPKNLQRAGSGTYWPAKTVDAQGIALDYPFLVSPIIVGLLLQRGGPEQGCRKEGSVCPCSGIQQPFHQKRSNSLNGDFGKKGDAGFSSNG